MSGIAYVIAIGARVEALLAKRGVFLSPHHTACAIGRDVGTAEMVEMGHSIPALVIRIVAPGPATYRDSFCVELLA